MRLSSALLATLILLAGLAAAPGAQAAINGARAYRADYDYMPELDAAQFIMASGSLEADMPNSGGSFGFIATEGAEISGLTRVCWTSTIRQCADSPGGNLRIVVPDQSSFGVLLPDGVEARLTADHALAMFADLGGEADLNSLALGKSVLAPMVSGVATLRGIPNVPITTLPTPVSPGEAVFTLVDDQSTAQIVDGSTVRFTVRGKSDPVTFAGSPEMSPVACELAVLPFVGTGDVARFRPAGHDAALRGLDIGRINRLMDRLYNANQGQPTNSVPLDADAFGPYADAAASLFDGAVLRVPTQGQASGTDFAFARVTRLEVAGLPGDGIAWSGRASLEIRDGHVAGAKDLAGAGFLQMPWWSWVLWVLALAALIVRLVRKPEKKHATWDRLKWIGWIAGPLMFLLAFWLWDLEVRALLGLSLFSGGTGGGQVLLLIGLLQVATFFAASFAAMAPLRMLFRNGSLLLGQGTFMGLSGAAASLLGFLFIVTYLRSYLDVVFSTLLAGIS